VEEIYQISTANIQLFFKTIRSSILNTLQLSVHTVLNGLHISL
jgi:hypothetical protein